MNIRGHARIAKCAHQDGVKIAAQHGKAVGRHSHAIGQVVIGAPVELGHLDGRTQGGEDLYSFSNYLWSDAISGNNSDAFFAVHRLEDYQLAEALSFRMNARLYWKAKRLAV